MQKKKLVALALGAALALSLAACGGSASEETEAAQTEAAAAAEGGEAAAEAEAETKDFEGAELVVATWGWAEAGLKELAAEFEETYNCTIVTDPTSGNGDRLNKLMAEKNAPTADVALLTKNYADMGISEGLFDPIDTSVVTSVPDLYDIAIDENGYGPCYSLCRYGIMYNVDALEEAGLPVPTSYVELFDDKFPQEITFGKNGLDNYDDIADEYREQLQKVLTEIFNPEIPFTQTQVEKNCKYCDFKDICKR